MNRNAKARFFAILALAIIIFGASIGVLVKPKNQPLTSESPSTEKPILTDTKNEASFVMNESEKNSLINSVSTTNSEVDLASPDDSQRQSIDYTQQPIFQVTTDSNYDCTTGDPRTAIQNAIYSLPEDRTAPMNIYLRGTFNPVFDIVLESNINFIGNNAVLIIDSHESIFILNQTKSYDEIYSTLELDGVQYIDWFSLHNVTFQSINFKQPVEVFGSRYAINFLDTNSTGWGVSDNFNIYNSEFEGFINAVQGLAFESKFMNNRFSNYSNNGLLLVYGLNVTIQDNTFESQTSPISIEQYTSIYGPESMIGRVGLFLLDVCENVLVSNNDFIQGTNSTGLAFSSSIGNFLVTNNTFIGEGTPCLVDFNLRPFLSHGIFFYGNRGASDFMYSNGIYTREDIFDLA